MTDLSGHVSLVTGGSTGIGLGITRGLLDAGACVAVCGRSEARLSSAIDGLAAGDQVGGFVCDVSDEGQVARLFDEVRETFGGLDSCFANAAIGGTADVPFVDCTLEQWRAVQRTNLDGAFLTCREAARHMIAHHGGSIVVTSSTAASDGRAHGQAYAASKAGADAMVRGMAVELARHRIRVNAIQPGWFGTSRVYDFLPAEVVQKKVLPRVPMRRFGQEAEIAGLAVYLAGPSSSYMTGQTLVVDGGYSVF